MLRIRSGYIANVQRICFRQCYKKSWKTHCSKYFIEIIYYRILCASLQLTSTMLVIPSRGLPHLSGLFSHLKYKWFLWLLFFCVSVHVEKFDMSQDVLMFAYGQISLTLHAELNSMNKYLSYSFHLRG